MNISFKGIFLSILSFLTLYRSLNCPNVSALYQLDSISSTSFGWQGSLSSMNSEDAPLDLNVWYEEDYRIRATLRPVKSNIWEISPNLFKTPTAPPQKAKKPIYDIEFSPKGSVFSMNITRVGSTSSFFLSLQISNFTSSEHPYIAAQFWSSKSTGAIYGAGDRIGPLSIPSDQPLNIWSSRSDDLPLTASSGSHPIVHIYDKAGTISTLIMRNSALQRFQYTNSTKSNPLLYWEAWGGVLDFYLLLGPAPVDIGTQVCQVIGYPAMPPLWSIGYHQSRWGYVNANVTQQVAQKYMDSQIPLDAIWNDVDYQDHYFEFSFDEARFNSSDLKMLQSYLHYHNKRHVLVINPSVPALLETFHQQPYTPYTVAKKNNLFIIHPNNKTILYTYTLPNVTTAIIDYTNPNSEIWLNDTISTWLKSSGALIDGIWLNSNEVTTSCDGEFEYSCNFTMTGPSYSRSPYRTPITVDPAAIDPTPPNSVDPIPNPRPPPLEHLLDYESVNISAFSFVGREYDIHNIYGLYQSIIAYNVLQKTLNERPFILSRSTFLGSGQWSATSVTNNFANWEDMRNSIAQVIRSGLSGITMAGADVCGYLGDPTAELCARWHQLGAFYPFMRNHKYWDNAAQEVYTFPEPFQSAIRTALLLRYTILPYTYTLLSEGHLSGTPLFRQLSWDYPKDSNVYDIDTQFMYGPGFLVSPILTPGATSVQAYVPAGIWYNFTTFEQIVSKGEVKTFYSDLSSNTSTIPILIQAAHFLCQQYPSLSTQDSHLNPFFYTVALDSTYIAHGHNVYDDGVMINALENNAYYRINSDAEFKSLGNGEFSGNINILTALSYPPFNVSSVNLQDIFILGLNGITKVPETWLSVNGGSATNVTSKVYISGPALVVSDINALYTGNIRLTFGKSLNGIERYDD